MKGSKTKHIVAIILLVVGIWLAATERVDHTLGSLGMQYLAESNDRYLEESMEKAVGGFLILSGIKTGLAVIEGSEIGVGFNLELGDVVQPVYDYVDIAWKTALAGGAVILLTRLVIQAVDISDHWCLALTLGAAVIFILMQSLRRRPERGLRMARDAVFFFTVLSVVLYFVFPLSITGAALLSKKITDPLISESQRSFESIKDEFSAENLNRRLFPDQAPEESSWLSNLLLRGDTEKIKEYFGEQAEYFKRKSRDIAIWTLQLIAGYLFDSIIFPLAFFLLLFVIAKGALLYLFEDRKQSTLRKELTTLVDSYHRLTAPKTPAIRIGSRKRSRTPRYRKYSRRGGS
jgi:hypothetical protein